MSDNLVISKQCYIIGGGNSINEGISLGLKEYLKDRFVITCNFSCYHFDSTLTTFIDLDFILGILNRKNNTEPIISHSHIEKIQSLPLLIGNGNNNLPNVINLKLSGKYSQNILTDGCYGCLTGIYSITLASWLMDFTGELFLLGFDFTREGQTHYYNEPAHRGINKVDFYNRHNPNKFFEVFNEKQPNIKIYNVNPNSNIECFPKIKYEQMFNKINQYLINKQEVQTCITSRFQKNLQ